MLLTLLNPYTGNKIRVSWFTYVKAELRLIFATCIVCHSTGSDCPTCKKFDQMDNDERIETTISWYWEFLEKNQLVKA